MKPLPCPFCGKTPSVKFRDYHNGITEGWIYHNRLMCPVEIKTRIYKTRIAAIYAWNRRTDNKEEK